MTAKAVAHPILPPAQTYADVTDQLASIPLHFPSRRRWLIALFLSSLLLGLLFVAATVLFTTGVGIWGLEHSGQLGVCDPQLCMVARHRPCGHADFGAAVAARSRLAQLAQPFRRNDDAVRSRLRRHLSDPASRPAVVRLLDVSISGDHESMAAIPQPARMGHLGGTDLSHRLDRLLVHRPRSRSRRGARPRPSSRAGRCSSAFCRSAGAARRCTGYDGIRPIASWPRLAVPLVVSVHSEVSLLFAAGTIPGWHSTIFPPYFVLGRRLLRICRGGDDRDRTARAVPSGQSCHRSAPRYSRQRSCSRPA